MSNSLETLNKGNVEDFGYSFGGVHRVLLGELPAMQTPQFCELASQVLIDIQGKLSDADWLFVSNHLQLAFFREETTKQESDNVLGLPRLIDIQQNSAQEQSTENMNLRFEEFTIPSETWEAINGDDEQAKEKAVNEVVANLIIKNNWTAQRYDSSPFEIKEDHILIGNTYQVDFKTFAAFVSYILAGGFFGWDTKQGMPKEAKQAISKLREIWG